MIRSRWLWLACCLYLVGCSAPPDPLQQRRIYAFGTQIDVSLYGVAPELAEQAFQGLGERFDWMHEAWHAWRPGTLSRTNQALQSGQPFHPEPGVAALLHQARDLSLRSHGLFNPAIGKLIALWGFHQDLPSGPPPTDAQLAPLVDANPQMSDIHFDGDTVSCTNPSVQVDLGGFAKGYGVDRAIEQLEAWGVENAVINAGGDLRAIGRHGDRPWHIGVRDPFGPGVIASLEVAGDESVFSSGTYERFYRFDGHTYPHIIDPRNGRPVTHTAAVTVIHSNATEADAAATALLVAGAGEWLQVARSMGIDTALLVAQDGTVYATEAMSRRAHFEPRIAPSVVVQSLPANADGGRR